LRSLRNDVAAEGGLNELELIEGQAGDAAVIGVLDFVALAERGAQHADRISPVSLDFEMNGADWLQGGYSMSLQINTVKIMYDECVATFAGCTIPRSTDIIGQNANYRGKAGAGKMRIKLTSSWNGDKNFALPIPLYTDILIGNLTGGLGQCLCVCLHVQCFEEEMESLPAG
jgi:hypothetical protein